MPPETPRLCAVVRADCTASQPQLRGNGGADGFVQGLPVLKSGRGRDNGCRACEEGASNATALRDKLACILASQPQPQPQQQLWDDATLIDNGHLCALQTAAPPQLVLSALGNMWRQPIARSISFVRNSTSRIASPGPMIVNLKMMDSQAFVEGKRRRGELTVCNSIRDRVYLSMCYYMCMMRAMSREPVSTIRGTLRKLLWNRNAMLQHISGLIVVDNENHDT